MYSRTVTEYLNQTVEKYPDKIAVQDSKRSLSFREVQKEAMQLASFLSPKKFFKKPIAIFLEKSTECFSSIFLPWHRFRLDSSGLRYRLSIRFAYNRGRRNDTILREFVSIHFVHIRHLAVASTIRLHPASRVQHPDRL